MLSNKYNDHSQTTNGSDGNSPKTQKVIIIAGVLIALLILLNVVICTRANGKQVNAENLNEQQTKAMSDLQREINSANARFDSLSALFPIKEEEIESLKKQLEEKNQELQRYIAQGGSLSAARNEIASLKDANQSLQSQLQQERNLNATSQARIDELTRELQSISEELNRTRGKLSTYESQASSSKPSDNTPQPSTNDNSPSPSASQSASEDTPCTVSGVSVKANEISKKDPNKKRSTSSALKTGELQVCFIVEATQGVRSGSKEFHIQIIDPAQTTIGSETAPDAMSGNSYKYTLKETLNYDGANAQACAYYKSSDFQKGTYQVNVWNKGVKVGTGSLTLKK